MFTNALWDLFSTLSTWQKNGVVTLELSAHSPSDSKHFYKELDRRMTDTGWSKIRVCSERQYHNPIHGWQRGRRTRQPGYVAKMRVLGPPNGIKFDLRARSSRTTRTLPEVRVVGSLVIRRQFYRAFSVAKALQPIIQCFTQLRDFAYEPWRGINKNRHFGRTMRDKEHQILFRDVLRYRNGLRRVSIFEDFHHEIHTRNERKPSTFLGKALAKTSRNLTDLHASHSIDAKDFFYGFWPGQGSKKKKEPKGKN